MVGGIGAGTILKPGNIVRGVTTAATLWLTTVIGLCFGSGAWPIGLAATLSGLFTLQALRRLEAVLRRRSYGTMTVDFGPDADPEALLAELDALGMTVKARAGPGCGGRQPALHRVASGRAPDLDPRRSSTAAGRTSGHEGWLGGSELGTLPPRVQAAWSSTRFRPAALAR